MWRIAKKISKFLRHLFSSPSDVFLVRFDVKLKKLNLNADAKANWLARGTSIVELAYGS